MCKTWAVRKEDLVPIQIPLSLSFQKPYVKSSRTPLSLERLAQELVIRKCEDVETKNSYWAKNLITT